MIGDSNIRINKVRTVAVLKLLKIKILKNNNDKSNDSLKKNELKVMNKHNQ